MDRILQYVRWRGDLPLSPEDFCLADNLVLSALSYLKFPSVDWETARPTLKECVQQAEQAGGLQMLTTETNEEMYDFVRAAARSERFGRLFVRDYVDAYYPEGPVQFSAVTFWLDEKTSYVAFRGTDNSLAGWKEDFMIAFTRTKAQSLAAEYLNHAVQPGQQYYVGGHSKGANLALYAAAVLPPEQRTGLKRIFVNDGPGFCGEVLDLALLDGISSLITLVQPVFSVVGQLFTPEAADRYIVNSSARGLMQHSIFSWGVAYGELDTAPEFDAGSLWLRQVLDRWVSSMPIEERENATEQLFEALSQNGAERLSDLTEHAPETLERFIATARQFDPSTKNALKKLPAAAIQTGSPELDLKTVLQMQKKRSKFREGISLAETILLGVLSLLLLIFPTLYAGLYIPVVVFLVLLVLIRLLLLVFSKKGEKMEEKEKTGP